MIEILTILASTETAEPQGIAALGLNFWTIIAQGATFLVFFLIIKKFAFGKIVDTLETRRKTIESSLDKAEELSRQNKEAEQRVAGLLSEARKEAEEVIDMSREEAGAIVADAESSAVTKAEKIIADGKLQIEAEVVKAREALKKETLSLVAEATAAVLGESVDVKKSEALIKKALKENA
ncbi:MAG TPA: F0F1 ATP synthase subunit B [Candidatus Saccharibacteria bacterium]|jgi:F-type H+-transporting ATPase subunit b|nr:F-type H+-transporting ATPase subunit b [Patescibacteria group bacterium]HMS31177.1 F0F1 ATP synthase subunit B [Candidatus Saccharibacteria bacterium]